MQVVSIFKKFQDLDVWQKAYSVSLDVHKATLEFPKAEQFALSSQMRRASKSICANIAEGYSKQLYSKAEFKRYLQMALGSANEMMVWIMYARDLQYIDLDTYGVWEGEYSSICKMLNALHAKA